MSDSRLTETFKEVSIEIEQILSQINGYLEQEKVTQVIREGLKISILGPPNAGKSTLMNLLAKKNVAIVSDIPGTTRDLI